MEMGKDKVKTFSGLNDMESLSDRAIKDPSKYLADIEAEQCEESKHNTEAYVRGGPNVDNKLYENEQLKEHEKEESENSGTKG